MKCHNLFAICHTWCVQGPSKSWKSERNEVSLHCVKTKTCTSTLSACVLWLKLTSRMTWPQEVVPAWSRWCRAASRSPKGAPRLRPRSPAPAAPPCWPAACRPRAGRCPPRAPSCSRIALGTGSPRSSSSRVCTALRERSTTTTTTHTAPGRKTQAWLWVLSRGSNKGIHDPPGYATADQLQWPGRSWTEASAEVEATSGEGESTWEEEEMIMEEEEEEEKEEEETLF